MLNLLPEEKKNMMHRDYRLRVATLFFLLVGVGGMVTVIFFVPAYLVLVGEEETLRQNAETLVRATENEDDVYSRAQHLEEKIDLQRYTSTIRLLPLLNESLSARPSGVALEGFRYVHSELLLILAGTATTRAALVSYRDSLSENGHFASINLPIGDLASSENLQFSLTATLTSTTP